MGKNKRQKKNAPPETAAPQVPLRGKWRRIVRAACVALVFAGIATWYFTHASGLNTSHPTFAQDIAPVVHKQCAVCHHAGGSAPFALIAYADVAKHAAQIAGLTQRRIMPPWMPEHGYNEFEGERRLSGDEILMLKNWAAQGAAEGDPKRAPAPPKFDSEWQLGTPDLVVQMPHVYTLPKEGRDLYRNFAFPIPNTQDRFVKGIEFRAGTTRIHHAFIFIDHTHGSRRLDGKESEPGWPGMNAPSPTAETPSSQFTSWQPGRIPRMHEDMAWRLPVGTDLVLQLHMQPSGKPEPIQPSIAFYFTDRPGTVHPMIVLLRRVDIDIPAGEKAYSVRAQYTLPVDVDVLGLLPHLHYLGKDVKAFATLPDGSRTRLLWIKDWNFNWQSDYTCKRPVFVPKGSRLEMEYTFDNSKDNPLNPSDPPKRVQYGPNSTDEMAELWVQLVPHSAGDAAILQQDRARADMEDLFALNTVRLRQNPADSHAHLQLGKALIQKGQMNEAEEHLRAAVRFGENDSETHYFLAYYLNDHLDDPKLRAECLREFQRAVQLDPENFEALNGLGRTLLQLGDPRDAARVLAEALRLHPDDRIIKENLELARKALGKQ
ncbi:MAG TPA: tetratricopeptide repeat protein [Planctomycetota bacterium]|nr:tetratricopeptide repeat protein [Planctomycetota bacterium]